MPSTTNPVIAPAVFEGTLRLIALMHELCGPKAAAELVRETEAEYAGLVARIEEHFVAGVQDSMFQTMFHATRAEVEQMLAYLRQRISELESVA